MINSPGFTGSPLDRLETVRTDPAAFAAMARRPDALSLVLDDYQPTTENDRLAWTPLDRSLPLDEFALLGTIHDVPRFLHLDPAAAGARRTPELFAVLATLATGESATYAVARSLADWHARHRFCANCGTRTAPFRAGWARLCPACATEHYPRTDPVVIMLAEHRDATGEPRILLGRQPAFPPGRYSALAGFVEVGESLEEAVIRELREEAGVAARDVRYLTSQPWPFPSQLMLACVATVDDPTIRLDTTELEDARWATRSDVAAALADDPAAPFSAPPPYAIAHTLLRAWVEGGWSLS